MGDTQPTAASPLTDADYRTHMQGWQAGVSGHQMDEKAGHQYRIGFGVGRELRTGYARSVKGRVAQ
jgi:hypothetical protein